MKASTLQTIDKGKHGLYLFSIGVLFFLTALAFLHAPASTIHMDFLAAVMPRWALTLLVLALAVVLAFVLLFFYQKLISCRRKPRRLSWAFSQHWALCCNTRCFLPSELRCATTI